MTNKNDLIEVENRYCPICGDRVRAGTPLHQCNEKKLKEIEKERQRLEKLEEENIIKTRNYDDRLKEFEEYYNSETYNNDDED